MHMLSQKTTKKCEKRVKNAYVIICTLYFLIYRCTTFLKDDEYSKDSNDQSVTTPISRPSAAPEFTLEIKNEKKCI